MDRHSKFLSMKDVLEHLSDCHHAWQTGGAEDDRFLVESMKRDLDEVRRLCESLAGDRKAPAGPPATNLGRLSWAPATGRN